MKRRNKWNGKLERIEKNSLVYWKWLAKLIKIFQSGPKKKKIKVEIVNIQNKKETQLPRLQTLRRTRKWIKETGKLRGHEFIEKIIKHLRMSRSKYNKQNKKPLQI